MRSPTNEQIGEQKHEELSRYFLFISMHTHYVIISVTSNARNTLHDSWKTDISIPARGEPFFPCSFLVLRVWFLFSVFKDFVKVLPTAELAP